MIIVALQFGREPAIVHLNNVPVEFTPFRDPEGVNRGIANIDENTPDGAVALDKIQRMPRSYRVADEGDPSLPSTRPTEVVASPSVPSLLSPAVSRALANGWDARDLQLPPGKPSYLDSRITDWQALGPAASGLTIAEMACCAPPPRWAEYRDTQQWPWEVPGFSRPVAGWTPPTLPRPAAPVREPVDTGIDPAPETPDDDTRLFDDTPPPPITPDPGDESDVIRAFRARANFEDWLNVMAAVVNSQADPEDKPSRQKVAARARANKCGGNYTEDDHNALWYLHQLKLSQDAQSAPPQE